MWRHLTSEHLREVVSYDEKSGVFTRNAGRYAGLPAGAKTSHGYVTVQIEGRPHYAHRLAWLYVFGKWPANVIDHINGDTSDNSIDNLRDVSHAVNLQNMRNAHANTTSGLLGACWDVQRGKWRAYIRLSGKSRYLGIFATAEEAHAAYVNHKRRLHAGCTI